MEKIETLFSSFETLLDETIEKTWESPRYAEALCDGLRQLQQSVIDLGETHAGRLSAGAKGDTALFGSFLVIFSWVESAKSFLILWRDVYFQQLKAQVLKLDKSVRPDDLKTLREQSRQTVLSAAGALKDMPKKEAAYIRSQHKGISRQVERWERQQSPWPTYKAQLERLPQQCDQLTEQYRQLRGVSSTFQDIRALTARTIAGFHRELEQFQTTAHNAVDFIRDNIQNKPGRINSHLEALEKEIPATGPLVLYQEELDRELPDLPLKLQPAVGTESGMILYRELNLRRIARQWMESEILPLLYDSGESIEQVRNMFKLSLANIRNRAILLANDSPEDRKTHLASMDIYQPMEGFRQKLAAWKAEIEGLDRQVNTRMRAAFRISGIYDTSAEFLALTLQSSINQLKINRNQLLTRIQDQYAQVLQRLRRFKSSVEQEEALSLSEKLVRFIQIRTADPENSQYSSIFLTKGYIGESFWVGREAELNRIEKLIGQWRNGFRGAVCLTGQRFAGKSLFGDLVAHRYFAKNTIVLTPDTTIAFQGRKFTVTHNLGEALEFIRKYAIQRRPLVWIDDLELWQDFHANMQKLLRFIDNHSGRLFVMVAMSNWQHAGLNRIYDIGKYFQARINLDRMGVEDIRQAILIRHGATHKTLSDAEGTEISPGQFTKMTEVIYRVSGGNVGEALNLWSSFTRKLDDNKVIHQYRPGFPMPDFINPDNGILLTSVMMEKHTTEYRLRKLFGPAFSDKYSYVLQRLLNVKLLIRRIDGQVEVNEVTANELGRLLERHKFITFQQ